MISKKDIQGFVAHLKSVGKVKNQQDFGAQIGIANKSYLSQVLAKKEIDPELVAKINEVYPEFEVWLNPQAGTALAPVETPAWVPYFDVDFAGGWNSSELMADQKPSFFITSPEFERAEFACNLFGHSISNRIAHRSVIGLREVFDWQTYFPTNEIYAVVLKNNLRTVKIVKRSKVNDSLLELIPDPKPEHNNTGYDKEDVPMDFVTRFFQVVAWGTFERIAN